MKGQRVAIFRFDASPTIGAGHAVRCSALALELMNRNWRCIAAMGRGSEKIVRNLVSVEWSILELQGAPGSEPSEIDRNIRSDRDVVIVDHYDRGFEFEKACSSGGASIVVIDDLPTRPHHCDLLLDQTFGRPSADYLPWVPEGAEILAGAGFSLLRPEFRVLREGAIRRRRGRASCEQILVLCGATDPQNLTVKILQGLLLIEGPVRVDVVLGSQASCLDEVQRLVSADSRICLFVDDREIAQKIAEADLIIGAAGSSVWEFCCLGAPAAVAAVAANQVDIAKGLGAAGAALDLGAVEFLSPSVIAEKVRPLLVDFAQAREMSLKAASICDGKGAARVVDRIESLGRH